MEGKGVEVREPKSCGQWFITTVSQSSVSTGTDDLATEPPTCPELYAPHLCLMTVPGGGEDEPEAQTADGKSAATQLHGSRRW